MARIKGNNSEGYSGKLGPTVGYKWKGRQCVRALVVPKDPKTPAQLESRCVFGKASSLGARMLPIVRIGFRGVAAAQGTTEKNIFVRLNRRHISVVDGKAVVDYSRLQVADGPLETVAFGEPVSEDGRTIHAAFSDSSHSNRLHYVMLAAYLPQQRNCMLSEPVFRSTGEAVITLPVSWTGCEAHIYGFCWDGKDEASPSSYIGTVNTQYN